MNNQKPTPVTRPQARPATPAMLAKLALELKATAEEGSDLGGWYAGFMAQAKQYARAAMTMECPA